MPGTCPRLSRLRRRVATRGLRADDRAATAFVTVLHIRELAVSASHRRTGVATRLLRRAELDGRARGASLALVYAWLPADRAEPEAVPFYGASGYVARRTSPISTPRPACGSAPRCPYCGDPPCRCSARVFVKELAAPA